MISMRYILKIINFAFFYVSLLSFMVTNSLLSCILRIRIGEKKNEISRVDCDFIEINF